MATRDIYKSGFDEVVQTDETTSGCPECGGRVEMNAVETVCEECGLVIDEHAIDHGGEPVYDDEDERTGAPLTASRHDRRLSTTIGRKTDAKGNTLSTAKRRQLGRLRREQRRGRFRSKAERNLGHGLGEVQRVVSVLELSETHRERACRLFRSAQNEGPLRGRSIESMAAASVYAACRCTGHLLPQGDIVDAARVEKSRVMNAYSVLNEELGLPAQPMRPRAFLARFSSNLDLPGRIRRRAESPAERAQERGVIGGVTTGFAAACLYVAAGEADWPLTKLQVAETAGVSANTVRTHRDTLSEMVDNRSAIPSGR
ncbi:transcription initiation factor TFIIB [Halarchaeum solikamskense]|uniref:transcription initiation factor IIB n=1 Tax=Halarchaeum nitratireducens TaxID=489913 RepID=UPI001B3AA47A|nr:transcription initiation factor IIB family protein [Halarchaeum solikamskense]MBP2252695.1 transcription initiation factor TFIIB [Halarchaeum solikamskense]